MATSPAGGSLRRGFSGKECTRKAKAASVGVLAETEGVQGAVGGAARLHRDGRGARAINAPTTDHGEPCGAVGYEISPGRRPFAGVDGRRIGGEFDELGSVGPVAEAIRPKRACPGGAEADLVG